MGDEGQRVVKFNQEHYDLLVECSEKGDMAEWNEWYRKYKNAQKDAGKDDCGAWLEGAYLRYAHLEGATLYQAHLEEADISGADISGANISGAKLQRAHLEWADMTKAHMEQAVMIEAKLQGAHLEGADMTKAHMEQAVMIEAKLQGAHLEGADMRYVHLEKADLRYVHLDEANMIEAHLEGANISGAKLQRAHLEGADLGGAHLEGASFHAAWLNEKTDLLGCTYDSETDFTATSLTSAHIEPDTLTALQKNIRRKYWVKWYDQHKILQYPCRLFWWLSDYGTSSTRCIGAFALLILAACVIYFFITSAAIADIPQLFADTILATFGFGSLFDQLTGPLRLLLAAHVLAGYFLLAVLITRFAVMFQSLTP